jgi:hypothetical protein
MSVRGKNRSPVSVTFNGIIEKSFAAATIAQNEVVGTVVDYISLPFAYKIVGVSIVPGAAYVGTPTLQLVFGSGAPVAVGSPDTNAVAGTTVFAAPIALASAAYVPQIIAATTISTPGIAQIDTIYPKGVLAMTMRVVSGAGVTATGIKVSLAIVPQDAQPTQPWPLF